MLFILKSNSMKYKNYMGVLKYTALGLLLGIMLVVNGILLNIQSGFKGAWFTIFDYSPDFVVIVLTPIILSLLFCYIGVRREQLVMFNDQIKQNLTEEQLISSAAAFLELCGSAVATSFVDVVVCCDVDRGFDPWL